MNTVLAVLFWLFLRFVASLVDFLQLVVTVSQIAIYRSVDCVFRWTVSMVSVLVPSVSSGVDQILAYFKIAPLNNFPPGHYPRLQAIVDAIQQHLQNPQYDPQVINAYQNVLLSIHDNIPDFPNMTVDDIRLHFAHHWPRISPLSKGSCLSLAPTGICWGMVHRGSININEPTIWINPYLVQALEAVQEGSDIHAYLRFLTIITVLHEAMHLLVQLVSPGTLTPIGGDIYGESGFRFENLILQGTTLYIEVRESDVFHLTRVRRLLLRPEFNPDHSESFWTFTGQICREAVGRFLQGESLWIARPELQTPQPQLDDLDPPEPRPLIRAELVSSTLVRLRSSSI
ncbi:hypothetical protein M378DRAFT_171676 [Amanita muscaria Koide BX008]|uniref:Uncharacterized protein n=1 Tax=Amanita muscaria (strain Koide BX008) TaxID=946122 RepID=A0A0C2W8J3_AMAMK|nr:hypothetical protein M378DRAFT_171676 [Amanita muscaria Koide BX008]